MTAEELASEGLKKRMGTMGYLNIQNVQKPYTDGFLDGYNAALAGYDPYGEYFEKGGEEEIIDEDFSV